MPLPSTIERDATRDALARLIADVDAAFAACPVNNSRRFIEVCPKCQATERDRCPFAAAAEGSVVAGVRELLADRLTLNQNGGGE